MAQNKGVILQSGKYRHPSTGVLLPRISDLKEMQNKPALNTWKVNTAVEYAVANREAWSQLDERSAIDLLKRAPFRQSADGIATGNEVHKIVENLAAGKSVKRNERNGWVLDAWESFVAEYQAKVLESEAVAWHPNAGYAGRLDLLVEVSLDERTRARWGDGLPNPATLVVDAKSTRSGIWPETAIQCCAYGMAPTLLREDGTEEAMPEIHGTAALWLRPDGWALQPLRFDIEVWRAVRALAALYRWDTEYARGSVLTAVNADPLVR